MNQLKPDRFRLIYDRVAWGAITLIAMYSANMLRELTDTVHTMSTNLAVMAERVAIQDVKQKDFDTKLERHAELIKTLELSSAVRPSRRIRSLSVDAD